MALIGTGDIIVNSWKNLRANLKQYSEFVLWLVLLGAAEWALGVVFKSAFPDKQQRTTVLVLAALPIRIADAVVAIAIMDTAAKSLQRQATFVRSALSHGLHAIIPFIWVSILYALVSFGGLLLLVIPGFYFIIRYKFAPQFLVVDGVRGKDALAMSGRITRGRWWATLWRTSLTTIFFSLALGLAANLIQLALGSLFGDPGLFFGTIAGISDLPAGYSLVVTLISQLIAGYGLVLFLNSDMILWLSLKQEAMKSGALES
jgi:hypothetical protein